MDYIDEYTRQIAIQTAFLVRGASRAIDDALCKARLNGVRRVVFSHEALEPGGYTGMVENMVDLAKQVVDHFATIPVDQDYPGVIEYEVTEVLGSWWAEKVIAPRRISGKNLSDGLINFSRRLRNEIPRPGRSCEAVAYSSEHAAATCPRRPYPRCKER